MLEPLLAGRRTRRVLLGIAVLFFVACGSIGLAGTYVMLDAQFGVRTAVAGTVISGLVGACVLWPAWYAIRSWAGVPVLDTYRRELLAAIAQLPASADGIALSECVLDVLQRLMPGRSMALLLPEPRSDRLTPAAIAGPDAADLQRFSLPRRSALTRALEREGKPLVVTRWAEEGDGGERPATSDTIVPLTSRRNLVGVLVIGPDRAGRNLSQSEAAIAFTLGAEIAIAEENAHLYGSLRSAFTDIEQAQNELLALQRASTAAQSTLNMNEVLRNLCNGVIDAMDFHDAIVFLVDPETKAIVPACAAGRAGTPQIRARGRTVGRAPLTVHGAASNSLFRDQVLISHDPAESILPYLVDVKVDAPHSPFAGRSVVTVPLIANADVVGGMALLTERRIIADREIDSLRGFAAQAAAAIVNARLYEDLREAYDNLRIAQDEIVRTERLRSVGELASGVAHDFNNILVAVLTHAQLAIRQTDEPAMRHAFGVIEQAALDGSEVVRRIQNLARTRQIEIREPIDLNTVMRQSLETTTPIWRSAAEARGVTIEARLEAGPTCQISGSPAELREVFTNLILNACHAMPRGGTLTLRCREEDGHTWGEVEDTGTGMTPEVRKRLFEPFFTTKGAAGSGLGMSIVQSIVQRHAGIVEVESAPGEGTTIRVGFPTVSQPEAPVQPLAPRRIHLREPLRILIVDDDTRAREALTLILQQLGHEVRGVGDGQAALRIFLDGNYQIVFSDLNLGEMSGWEVALAVKKMRRTTHVVLVTGWATTVETDDLATRGVDQLLAKPFTLDEVEQVLERGRREQTVGQR